MNCQQMVMGATEYVINLVTLDYLDQAPLHGSSPCVRAPLCLMTGLDALIQKAWEYGEKSGGDMQFKYFLGHIMYLLISMHL